jgi:hypothetical protein
MNTPFTREVSRFLASQGVPRRSAENPNGFSVGGTLYGARVRFPRNAPKAYSGSLHCAALLAREGFSIQQGIIPLEVRVFPSKDWKPPVKVKPTGPRCPMCRSRRLSTPKVYRTVTKFACQNPKCRCQFNIKLVK